MRPTWHGALHSLCALSACALFGAPSLAQTPSPTDSSGDAVAQARERYDAGTRAFGQGRFVEAALEFEAAASEKPSAVALYTAALSWERANAPDRAADDYARTVATPGLPPEQAGTARDRLVALERVLGTLSVTAPDGWRVQLDGNTEVMAPALLHGAAGVHTLEAHTAERSLERTTVVLRSGVTTTLGLPLNEASIAPPPPPSVGVEVRRGAGLVMVGAAGAALLAGGLLGIEALEARDAYDSSPDTATLDHASHLQTWTNVAFAAGGCLMAAGLALTLWPAPRSASTSGARPQALVRVGFVPGGLVVDGRLPR